MFYIITSRQSTTNLYFQIRMVVWGFLFNVYPLKTYICFLLQTKNGAKAHKRLINSIQANFIISEPKITLKPLRSSSELGIFFGWFHYLWTALNHRLDYQEAVGELNRLKELRVIYCILLNER